MDAFPEDAGKPGEVRKRRKSISCMPDRVSSMGLSSTSSKEASGSRRGSPSKGEESFRAKLGDRLQEIVAELSAEHDRHLSQARQRACQLELQASALRKEVQKLRSRAAIDLGCHCTGRDVRGPRGGSKVSSGSKADAGAAKRNSGTRANAETEENEAESRKFVELARQRAMRMLGAVSALGGLRRTKSTCELVPITDRQPAAMSEINLPGAFQSSLDAEDKLQPNGAPPVLPLEDRDDPDEKADDEDCQVDARRNSFLSSFSANSEAASSMEAFCLYPVWIEEKRVGAARSHASNCQRRGALVVNDLTDSDSDSDYDVKKPHRSRLVKSALRMWGQVVLPPSSGKRVFWDVLATILLVWEAIWIPLQLLELPETPAKMAAGWAARAFWTLDLPLSFLTGFHRSDGHPELDPLAVARQYLKTWFLVDLSTLVVDWADVLLGIDAASLGKTLKTVRLIRMLRLGKLMRVSDSLPIGVVEQYINFRKVIIIFGVVKILVFLIWVNHVIACGWYGVALSHQGSDNWISWHNLDQHPPEYRYATAFHWSLTQFTGTMEVTPRNLSERFYAVVVLLFAFVTSASVVSAITSSMTRLEIATAQEAQQANTLKRFLYLNHIPSRLSLRVQRNAQHILSQQRWEIPEGNVELLSVVSEPLRIELHFEMHIPLLSSHPFLRKYAESGAAPMRQVCHLALTRVALSSGDVLFSEGEIPLVARTYFVIEGCMSYMDRGSMGMETLGPSGWACEAVLWTPWVHTGTMRSKTHCSLLALDAERFQAISSQFQNQVELAQRYGEGFVSHCNSVDQDELTDLEDKTMGIEALVLASCVPKEPVIQSLSIRPRGVAGGGTVRRASVGMVSPVRRASLGMSSLQLPEGGGGKVRRASIGMPEGLQAGPPSDEAAEIQKPSVRFQS